VGIFQTMPVVTPTIKASESTEFEIKVTEINGMPALESETNVNSAYVHKSLIEQADFKLVFTTDFYPGETTWTLKDEFDTEIASASYVPGNDDQFGGGGPDANRAHEYDITLQDMSAECLTMEVNDAFGDGLSAFNATHPLPGVAIYDADGNELKPVFPTEFAFTDDYDVRSEVALTSNANDLDIVNNLSVSPNPVYDILNVNVELAKEGEATMQIVNMFGQTMVSYPQLQNKIDVTTLATGNYTLVIRTNEGIATNRFVKI